MSWSSLLSGMTGSGRAILACPKCGKDSRASKFDVDAKGQRAQCGACMEIGALEDFRAAASSLPAQAPAGFVALTELGWAALAMGAGAAIIVALMAMTPPSPFPNPRTARAASAEWAKLTQERATACQGLQEPFHERCMGVYAEE